MKNKLSVIIPNYNTAHLTLKCLKHLAFVFNAIKHEIIIVDNHSQDHSITLIRKNFPQVKIIANLENRGFAAAVNQGIKIAQGEYILLLNTDAFVNQKLSAALAFLDQNPQVAILSPRLVYPDTKVQANFGHYPTLAREFLQATLLYKILPFGRVVMCNFFSRKKFYQIKQVKWLAATCLFVRQEVFKKIGLLDEKFFMYLEDVDFCKRARQAGWQIIFWGEGEVVHSHHGSARSSLHASLDERNSLLYFWQKHYPKRKLSYQIIKLLSWLKLQGKLLKVKSAGVIARKRNRADEAIPLDSKCR